MTKRSSPRPFTLADAERERWASKDRLSAKYEPEYAAQEERRKRQAVEDVTLRFNPEIGVLQRGADRAFYIFQEGREVQASLEELVAILAPKRQVEARRILGME